MTVDLHTLVLPAFDDLGGLPGEMEPWRDAYDFGHRIAIEGVPSPLRYTDGGVGIVPTGVGKTAAAATTTALCASRDLDLDGTRILSVGVAGGPPELPIGSVVFADCIVDWDDKCRFDPDGDLPLSLNPYTEGAGVFDLNAGVVESAEATAAGIELAAGASPKPPGAPDDKPHIVTGTNLCGDELWHGNALAEQATWLVEAYGRGPYRVTEMEDAGTAGALQRFGRLDQYLSVRGISNHDRPEGDVPAEKNFSDPAFESGFGLGLENAVRAAKAIVETGPA
jgi:purine nucleoside permease